MNRKSIFKKLQYGTNAAVFTATVIGVILLINLMIGKLHLQWDVTQNKQYSLSDESKNALRTIDQEVKVLFFVNPTSSIALEMKQLSENIRAVNNKVSLELIDPYRNPSVATQYEVTSEYTAIIMQEDRKKVVSPYDLILTNYETGAQSFNGEGPLMQAIMDVTTAIQPVIYIAEGHGEMTMASELSSLVQLMTGKGSIVHPLNLMETDVIPTDADILYSIGSQRDYSEKVIQNIHAFLERGGKLVLGFGTYTPDESLDRLKGLAKDLGVTVEDHVLLDPEGNYSGDLYTLIPRYTGHPVTTKIEKSRIAMIIPGARSLSIDGGVDGTLMPILQTTDKAWGETTLQDPNAAPTEGEQTGVLSVAVSVEKPVQDGKMQAIIIGNAFLADNQVIRVGGNYDFFLGGLQWMNETGTVLDIPPKEYTPDPILLSGGQAVFLFFICVLFIPIFIMGIGAVVWLRRKNL